MAQRTKCKRPGDGLFECDAKTNCRTCILQVLASVPPVRKPISATQPLHLVNRGFDTPISKLGSHLTLKKRLHHLVLSAMTRSGEGRMAFPNF